MAESSEVAVVGSGYFGLVTGACLAHLGYRVTCLDKNHERIFGAVSNPEFLREEGAIYDAPFPDRVVVGADVASKATARLLPSPKTVFGPHAALTGAHAAVVVTEREEVRTLDLARASRLIVVAREGLKRTVEWFAASSERLHEVS